MSDDFIAGAIVGIFVFVAAITFAALITQGSVAGGPVSTPSDADILVTQNSSELDEVLVQKGDYYCGVKDGAWNEDQDTDRCIKLLERSDAESSKKDGRGGD